MTLLKTFLLAIVFSFFFCDENEIRLERDLMRNYSKHIRPSNNHRDRLDVLLTVTLTGIIDVNWTDPKLCWDPIKYDNITLIHLPYDQVWKADIILHNSIDSSMKSSISTNIPISSQGQVLWWSQWIFKSTCTMDIQYFPFDVQTCFLDFGSWSFDNSYINVIPVNQDAHLDFYNPNSEFDFVEYSTHNYSSFYAAWSDPFLYVRYKIVIKRKPLYYLFNILMPTILLTIISLLGFFIHGSEEKISIGITTLLSMVVLQMVVADRLPPVSDAVPLISLYYGISILLISLSTSINALTMNIYHYGDTGREVPAILKRIFFGSLSRILFVSVPFNKTIKRKNPGAQGYKICLKEESSLKRLFKEAHDNQVDEDNSDRKVDIVLLQEMLQMVLKSITQENDNRLQKEQRSDALRKEWEELARVLDRLFLFIFLSVYACLTMYLFISH
ncbi:neuronal acetylcholine receptor subunit alpha-10-like isoform X2 [Saccostrea cucullata]|uniref:neuronal acetylcholine receptor subunit alpha-10-like isoform X2 n=1 Tax=Saccostrea cuccullata TaxID=36930 RepID=UPI002ED0A171